MDYRKISTEILECIGGEDNVSHFEHCSTRLRFTLKDVNKVKVGELKQVKGVLGVVMGVQCQVIIGNNVVEVYDEILKIASFDTKNSSEETNKDQKLGERIMDFVIGVFQPLVPAIAGAGVLKSIISFISDFNLPSNFPLLLSIILSSNINFFLVIHLAVCLALTKGLQITASSFMFLNFSFNFLASFSPFLFNGISILPAYLPSIFQSV